MSGQLDHEEAAACGKVVGVPKIHILLHQGRGELQSLQQRNIACGRIREATERLASHLGLANRRHRLRDRPSAAAKEPHFCLLIDEVSDELGSLHTS